MHEWTIHQHADLDLWIVTDGETTLVLMAPNVTEDEAQLVADTLTHYAAYAGDDDE